MGRKEILLDSVKKLLDLNVSDEEIVSDLIDAGIEKKEAEELLLQAKKEKGLLDVKMKEEIDSFDSKMHEFDSKPFKLQSESFFEKNFSPKEMPSFKEEKKEQTYSSSIPEEEDKSLTELWEKGIMATVDSKLEEMRRLKENIDAKIDSKINERIDSSIKRVNVLFESQKTLILSKTDSELNRKSEEITTLINSRINELKDLNREVKQSMQEFNKMNSLLENSMRLMESKSNEMDDLRSRLISEMNSELIQSKSKIESQLTEMNQRRKEIDSRIKRTLDLEQKLVEGLMDDAKNKIDKMAEEREQETISLINSRMKELESMQKRFNPDELNVRMNELKRISSELENKARSNEVFRQFKNEMQLWTEKHSEKFIKEVQKQVNEEIKQQVGETEKELKRKSSEVDELLTEIDLDEINATKEELKIFQKQFVNIIQQNMNEFNKSKKDLTQHLLNQEKSMNERIKLIDDKITELNKFEENFA
ncbi:MAG: hypothetical protein JW703_05085, partial [Candidatus Diapherotrites archaeon]|nr:hypothetical protein [Candidatus Diapherotrites archaeon]